jgi:uncharacterized protein (TIGR02679 family)
VVTVPASLRSPELDPLWARVRTRLEARGRDRRGRLTLPPLSSSSTLALKSLIGRQLGKTVDLAALEAGLARLRIGEDLPRALAALGYEISDEPARRRADRVERKEARSAARSLVSEWPEPWASEWIGEVIRAGILRGLGVSRARVFLQQVRAVLDCLEQDRRAPISRVDLAARVLGSAHALDDGTRIEAAVARALSFKLGPAVRRHLWAQAGVHLDLTSAPALSWRLPLTDGCGLARLSAAATDAGIPLHLSRFALEAHPAEVPRGSRILVVENPRVVEAAAQMRASTPVISTNGRPSSTVLLLLAQLHDAGAELRYHGDFDAAGLAICEGLMRAGLTPWRMNAADYLTALLAADAEGAVLPNDPQAPGPTPWDPTLQQIFDRERRIVHQERLLPGLIE